MISKRSLCLSIAALILLGVPAQAQVEEWDQAAVTELADQLAKSVKGLRDSARRDPTSTMGSGQGRAQYRLQDILRMIEQESRALHSHLSEGEGHDATLPIFERIEEMRVKAAENARQMFLPMPTQEKIKAARAVLEKIRPYYDAKPPTDAGLPGITD